MKKYIAGLMLGFTVAGFAPTAFAAPFCVEQQGLAKDCNYYDATQCRQRSQQVGGVCSINDAEVKLQQGVGKYCVVNSNHVSMCSYADRTTCDSEAARSGAVCVEFPESQVQPNPYRIDPNSKY